MKHESESGSGIQQSGLLRSVLTNPSLRRKLGKMPADEQTIALTVGDSDGQDTPNWKIGDVDSAQFVTLEVPADVVDGTNQRADVGFLPTRRVAKPGEGKRDDVDYRLVGRLGAGGTGIVYQAHQRAIDREVAVKMLREELSWNQASRNRFLAEARVIGGLDHPNVIALHELCVDERGGVFYSMKRIDGTSWDKQIAKMSVGENIDTLLRVADAIRYAHSRGLIHRDIKPENVMLGKFGEVLLADWGLAISHESGESAVGIHQSIGGTPAYMAPESARGNEAISYRTDVYLLGATLFQIETGYPPHRGSSLLACIHAAAHNEIRSTDVESELLDIAMKAMSTDPKDRYASVDELIAALAGQRQHFQSVRLVRRACERMARATPANHYEDFRVADALLMESLAVWPDNTRAKQARRKLQLEFAKAATQQGDLDLAVSLFEAAGEGDSPTATTVRQERELRDANQQQVSQYSALFTQSPEAGLLVLMATGKVVEANEKFGQLFGYSANDLTGRLMRDLNLWANQEQRTELVDELHRTGAINNFEAEFLHTDNHSIDVLISGRVVDVRGEEMLVATIRDISLRKKAENELRISQHRLRDLQKLAGLATWSYDVLSEKITWSEEAFLLADRRPEDGAPSREEFMELIHPEDREKLSRTINAALETGAAYELHVRQMGAQGQYLQLRVRGQPIFDEHGKTIEVYGVLIPERSAP